MDHRTGYYPDTFKPQANGRTHSSDIESSSSFSCSSSAISSSSYDSDDSELQELQAAEREWEENMRQLQLAVSVLIMPTLGKYLGRRWSYFLYAQYIKVGWRWTLFIPEAWLKRATS